MPRTRRAAAKKEEPTKEENRPERKPFSCGECERIYQQEGPSAFIATTCGACGLPMWFRSGERYREYRASKQELQE